ncbi:hypothetical protein [Rickettsia felis]|uniref:hypothetical protein n=1 Tax=Rickettsia felis TaxID=42862 RepID=UPI000A6B2BEE|nr:hypothetical protein [Rickettsia felis]
MTAKCVYLLTFFYKNSQEELLLNFDHYGNHSEAENFVNNHKLVEALGNLTVL